eukprot:symbB.v1.2.034083.t1/scaffold4337.1/size40994/3
MAAPKYVVVCGAGLAGASSAWHLQRRGAQVTLVDSRPPLTATSQYSTECYRDFFLDPALVPFMSRSVGLMEELAGNGNDINLTRRGYCFLAASEEGREAFEKFAVAASSFGAGDVRHHKTTVAEYQRSSSTGFGDGLTGFDLVYGSDNIQQIFPFGLGRAMLAAGGSPSICRGQVVGLETSNDRVTSVKVQQNDGQDVLLPCDAFVNSAGAWMENVNQLLGGSKLPLKNEVHAKVIFNDVKGVIPETAPFMVWRDKVTMDWDQEMKEFLLELDDTETGGIVNSSSWLSPQPGGQHLRPAGNGRVLMLWEHLHRHVPVGQEPEMPIGNFLEMYPELCLRGLKEMVPGLECYLEDLTKDTTIDGGYYTNSLDARPLVGPHGASNAYVCGGMGTYGLMGSPAAGELLAMHVMGEQLPGYADACTWPRRSKAPDEVIDLLDESA